MTDSTGCYELWKTVSGLIPLCLERVWGIRSRVIFSRPSHPGLWTSLAYFAAERLSIWVLNKYGEKEENNWYQTSTSSTKILVSFQCSFGFAVAVAGEQTWLYLMLKRAESWGCALFLFFTFFKHSLLVAEELSLTEEILGAMTFGLIYYQCVLGD